MTRGLEHLSRLRDFGLFRLQKTRSQGDHMEAFKALEGPYTKDEEACFTRARSDGMRENDFKLRVVLEYILGGNSSL